MAPADWDALRVQTRSITEMIEGDCLAQPFPSPFTKFAATVTIDGTRLDQVGIKKKGLLGSLNTEKPSLKLDFDEYVAGQRYLGLEKLTLNNANQDPAYVRQCLAYAMFRKAGLVASRCNFARVRVNGADLGVYVNVESVDHEFTRRNFANGDGNLYEGTLSDFRPGWTGTFDPKGTGDRVGAGGGIAERVVGLERAVDAPRQEHVLAGAEVVEDEVVVAVRRVAVPLPGDHLHRPVRLELLAIERRRDRRVHGRVVGELQRVDPVSYTHLTLPTSDLV